MKTRKHLLKAGLLAGCALAATGAAAADGEATSRLYIRGGLGAALSEDTELTEFFGEAVDNNKVKLDTGFRLDAAVGYRVTDWFAAEGELGVVFNTVDSVEGSTDADDLSFTQAPFLVNVVFQWPNRTRLVPYIGTGGGGSVNVINGDNFTLGGTTLDGSAGGFTWVYQAFGGLRYQINPQMSAGIAYKFSVTGDVEWEVDSIIGATETARMNGITTHSISAVFTFRF